MSMARCCRMSGRDNLRQLAGLAVELIVYNGSLRLAQAAATEGQRDGPLERKDPES